MVRFEDYAPPTLHDTLLLVMGRISYAQLIDLLALNSALIATTLLMFSKLREVHLTDQ
jgi:hypothetical protein